MDAVDEKKVSLDDIEKIHLPKKYRKMSAEEFRAHIKKLRKERSRVQKKASKTRAKAPDVSRKENEGERGGNVETGGSKYTSGSAEEKRIQASGSERTEQLRHIS